MDASSGGRAGDLAAAAAAAAAVAAAAALVALGKVWREALASALRSPDDYVKVRFTLQQRPLRGWEMTTLIGDRRVSIPKEACGMGGT